jgi:hypothetical protein
VSPASNRGASPGVIRAMEINNGNRAAISEGVKCTLCQARLRIDTDALTRLMEKCDTPACPNGRWRLVQATVDRIPERAKKQRTPRTNTGNVGNSNRWGQKP